MNNEKEMLIELIIKELREIQGELIIANAIHKELEKSNLSEIYHYNNGKFDAFLQILKFFGLEFERKET